MLKASCFLVAALATFFVLRSSEPYPPPPPKSFAGMHRPFQPIATVPNTPNPRLEQLCPIQENCLSFWPELHEEHLREPRQDERLLLKAGDKIVVEATNFIGTPVAFAMPLTSRARHVIQTCPTRWESDSYPDGPHESILWQASLRKELYESGLYIAMVDPIDREGNEELTRVVAFKRDAPGKLSIVDTATLDSPTWVELRLLDANGDGEIDLFVSSQPGTGPWGSVQVFSIRLDGQLVQHDFNGCPNDAGGGLFTAGGYFTLHDFNLDGEWEIETTQVVPDGGFTAFKYAYLSVFSVNPRTERWHEATAAVPWIIQPQRNFYSAYLEAAKKVESELGPKFGNEIESDYFERRLLTWKGQAFHCGEFESSTVKRLLDSWKP